LHEPETPLVDPPVTDNEELEPQVPTTVTLGLTDVLTLAEEAKSTDKDLDQQRRSLINK